MTITVRYLCATNSRGSRFLVSDGILRLTVPYDHAARDPSRAAMSAFLERFDIRGRFAAGEMPKGRVYVSVPGPGVSR